MVGFKVARYNGIKGGEGLQVRAKHAVLPDRSVQIVRDLGQVPFL